MKIFLTLISMVLVFRGCYCAVNNDNTVIVRASSSSNTTSANSTSSDENPLRNVIKCFKADSLFKCFNERVGLLINVWKEALLNSVRRNGDEPLVVNHSFEGVIRDLGNAVYYGFTSFFYSNTSGDLEEARLLSEETNSSDQTKDLGTVLIPKCVVSLFLPSFLLPNKYLLM